jgi:branched-chain amino acid transport system ATP-binding protein
MLRVENLDVFYGAIHALRDVSLEVGEGEVVAMIGANGAGKSTTLKAISGLVRPKKGAILYRGAAITALPAHRVVALGVSQVPEGRRMFGNLTVQENLEMGAYARRDRAGVRASFDAVYSKFPRLKDRRRQPAGTLSGGEQQMLAIGRALMAKPRLLLMDEPSMGLSPLLVREIFDTVRDLNRSDGVTILLVEQNAHMALQVASRAYVMETGRIVLSGPAAQLRNDPAVKAAYLGG